MQEERRGGWRYIAGLGGRRAWHRSLQVLDQLNQMTQRKMCLGLITLSVLMF